MADSNTNGLLLAGKLLFWLLATVYYMLEALVLMFVPKEYRMKSIKGNVALVTGGGSGIGRLMCLKLAAKGAIIVSWDLSHAGNNETAKQVRDAGGQCHTYTVDLCDRNAVYATASKVKQEVGRVDILVNNAGVVTGKGFLDSSDEGVVTTFNVNAISHFWTTKAFLGDMVARNKGHIVTVASMAGKVGGAGLVDYCSSKFAAVGFHESLLAELKASGKSGVKMTCVCPIVISTGMFQGASIKYLPTLKPHWVASEVVDAMLLNVSTLYLPKYMWTMCLQGLMLPEKSVDLLGNILEVQRLMKNFVGRRKTN